MPVSESANDPSNPNAAAGEDPIRTTAAAPAPASGASDQHAHHDHSTADAPTADAAAGQVVYACPMHPEVTSDKPGEVCPKCNMKLVPKK